MTILVLILPTCKTEMDLRDLPIIVPPPKNDILNLLNLTLLLKKSTKITDCSMMCSCWWTFEHKSWGVFERCINCFDFYGNIYIMFDLRS